MHTAPYGDNFFLSDRKPVVFPLSERENGFLFSVKKKTKRSTETPASDSYPSAESLIHTAPA